MGNLEILTFDNILNNPLNNYSWSIKEKDYGILPIKLDTGANITGISRAFATRKKMVIKKLSRLIKSS